MFDSLLVHLKEMSLSYYCGLLQNCLFFMFCYIGAVKLSQRELAFRWYFRHPSRRATLVQIRSRIHEAAREFVDAALEYENRKGNDEISCRHVWGELDHAACAREIMKFRLAAKRVGDKLKDMHMLAHEFRPKEIPADIMDPVIIPSARLRSHLSKCFELVGSDHARAAH